MVKCKLNFLSKHLSLDKPQKSSLGILLPLLYRTETIQFQSGYSKIDAVYINENNKYSISLEVKPEFIDFINRIENFQKEQVCLQKHEFFPDYENQEVHACFVSVITGPRTIRIRLPRRYNKFECSFFKKNDPENPQLTDSGDLKTGKRVTLLLKTKGVWVNKNKNFGWTIIAQQVLFH
tara:strand:- start:81 stop:617 length:537 start_codon:yes stop_codon:yes gene_type:complete